jgi:hypothetical protein
MAEKEQSKINSKMLAARPKRSANKSEDFPISKGKAAFDNLSNLQPKMLLRL